MNIVTNFWRRFRPVPVVVEIVREQTAIYHIGEQYSALEYFGPAKITLAPIDVPVYDVDMDKLGVINEYRIESGMVMFKAMMKDTPRLRKMLGIAEATKDL